MLALAAITGAAWFFLDEFRLRRLTGELAGAEIYRRMQRSGGRLAVIPKTGDTPYEFAAALRGTLQELAAQGGRLSLAGQAAEAAGLLIGGIVQVNYRPAPAKDFRLPDQWRKLRRQLFLVWLLKTWRARLAAVAGRWVDLSRRTGSKENRSEE
jgi:hypothetical protein